MMDSSGSSGRTADTQRQDEVASSRDTRDTGEASSEDTHVEEREPASQDNSVSRSDEESDQTGTGNDPEDSSSEEEPSGETQTNTDDTSESTSEDSTGTGDGESETPDAESVNAADAEALPVVVAQDETTVETAQTSDAEALDTQTQNGEGTTSEQVSANQQDSTTQPRTTTEVSPDTLPEGTGSAKPESMPGEQAAVNSEEPAQPSEGTKETLDVNQNLEVPAAGKQTSQTAETPAAPADPAQEAASPKSPRDEGWEFDEIILKDGPQAETTKTTVPEEELDAGTSGTETGSAANASIPGDVQINIGMDTTEYSRSDTRTNDTQVGSKETFEDLITESAERLTDRDIRTQETTSAATQTRQSLETERSVASQVIRGTLTVIKEGKNELRLQLRPPELGEMKISLKLENDAMTARIVVSSENVRNMVERQINDLRSALAGEGVKIEKFEVQVDQQQAQTSGQNQDKDESPWSSRGGSALGTSTSDDGGTHSWNVNRLMGENRKIHLIA